MSNVLKEEKKQQVIALGRLGWSMRRIEEATGVRRETAGAYLRAAGIAVRPPGSWGRAAPAKPANEVTPDSGADLNRARLANSKPANEVTPDSGQQIGHWLASRAAAVGACEPYRELIERGWIEAATPRPSGRIWFRSRLSRQLSERSSASSASFVDLIAGSRWGSSSRGRRRSPGRLRIGPMVRDAAERKVPTDTAVRDDPRL